MDWPLILAYHHVSADTSSRYVMSVRAFERQLESLMRHGYRPLSLEEAVASGPFGTGTAEPKTFTLTFDDGFESFRTLAMPVLTKLGLSGAAAVFVPTAFVGEENGWRDEPTRLQRLTRRGDVGAPLMTWEGLAEIAEAGVRVDPHGDRHLAMNELDYEAALVDAQSAREVLKGHGFDARFFALPYGWYSEPSKRAIEDAGFEAAFSVTHGGHDRYEIRRVPIYGTDDRATSALKLSGRYWEVFDVAARLAGRRQES